MIRREFLALAGGATAAAVGWHLYGRSHQAPDIQGRMVGANAALGHRLLAGGLPKPSRTVRTHVVIAGGGMAGLNAAWALDRSRRDDYLLLEAEDEAGGTSRWEDAYPASPCPWGAHYLPIPSPESEDVRELLADLGVLKGFTTGGRPIYDERHICHAPQERLHLHGIWQEGLYPHTGASREELRERDRFASDMQRWRVRAGRDGRPAFAIPVALSSRDPEILALDRISMARYLDQNGFTGKRLRWYVDYGCRDDYGCDLETTSAWAGIHYFASRGRGSVEGLPDTDEVLTWPEGNGWIARQLRERAGHRVKTGALVTRIANTRDGVEVDWLDAATGAVTRVAARHAIAALPRFVAARVVEGYQRRDLSAFTYAPWVVTNIAVRQPPPERARHGAALSWDNVFYDSPTLGYVVATHQSLRTVPGPTVLTHYQPLVSSDPRAARREAQAAPWEHWRDRVLTDMARAHPDFASIVDRLDVMVWGHAMVRPIPGLLWSNPRQDAAKPLGRVHFAHCDLSALPIFEEAQHHALNAVRAVISAG